MRRRAVDAVAAIVGREVAEELAADVYREPPAQQLTPEDLALLADAQFSPDRFDGEAEP